MEVGRQLDTSELLDLFEPDEGTVNFYYGRIGNGKTYAATADILDHLDRGRVVYCNWHINYEGFDQRKSFAHRIMHFIFFRKRYYRFRKENLRYFSPDDVDIAFLSGLTDCEIFVDEGQWIFDSYEGRQFSPEKRRLILHTRHVNRSINIISQRTQAVQVSARGQVNRFFKCEKKMSWPFLIFRRAEYQDMSGDDVDETADPISVKSYFASSRVLNAYDTKYLRAGIPKSQKVEFDAWELGFWDRTRLLFAGKHAIEALGAASDAPALNDIRMNLITALHAVSAQKARSFHWSQHVLDLSPETRPHRRLLSKTKRRSFADWARIT